MRRIHGLMDRILKVFLSLALGTLVVVTFLQVISRYAAGRSYAWAEDLCVLIFCWSVWTTACLLIKDQRHLRLTVLVDRLGPRSRRFIERFW